MLIDLFRLMFIDTKLYTKDNKLHTKNYTTYNKKDQLGGVNDKTYRNKWTQELEVLKDILNVF